MRWILFVCGFLCLLVQPLTGDEKDKAATSESDKAKSNGPRFVSAEAIAKQVRDSVVVIMAEGRDGKTKGIGSGFVVDKTGLVVTNLHVIGEGRRVTVKLANGKTRAVHSIHASDRHFDLAILRVAGGDEALPALKLGDPEKLSDGTPIVVMGNPHGLNYSVVSGVLSGRRQIEGREMLQLAIPIEPGNSGGPAMDLDGRVHGVVTMKSAVTNNLGFAISANAVRKLLDSPNPVPIERWLTIGKVDATRWEVLFGARWQQRGGRILATTSGEGFGGRSLCLLRQQDVGKEFELATFVKLDDESGAAGLVFHADGGDRHYGFYPSGGALRLSRFDGPNVFSWNVLQEVTSPHYRPGEWNHLKVSVSAKKIRCFVNDQLVIESEDKGLTSGRVGLAKFRTTRPEFRQFAVGRKLPPSRPSTAIVNDITKKLKGFDGSDTTTIIPQLTQHGQDAATVLKEQARELEQRAERLRQLAADVRTNAILQKLNRLIAQNGDFDLVTGMLLIAQLDEEELDVDAYRDKIDAMAREIKASIKSDKPTELELREALGNYLFQANGYHGNRFDYYHRANSYLNRVIDDRTGLPISLSILYMELGRRIGIQVVGVGLPGHFVVRHEPKNGTPQLIDVFEQGKLMTRKEAEERVRGFTGGRLDERFFAASTSQQIMTRVLINLQGIAQQTKDNEAILRYLSARVAVDSDDHEARGMRAILRHQTGRRAAALVDLDWFLENQPAGINLDAIREMRRRFENAP